MYVCALCMPWAHGVKESSRAPGVEPPPSPPCPPSQYLFIANLTSHLCDHQVTRRLAFLAVC